MKALVGTFNQEKALVGAISVIVQLHRLIDLRHSQDCDCKKWSFRTELTWCCGSETSSWRHSTRELSLSLQGSNERFPKLAIASDNFRCSLRLKNSHWIKSSDQTGPETETYKLFFDWKHAELLRGYKSWVMQTSITLTVHTARTYQSLTKY